MKLRKLFAENFCCFPSLELPLENQGLVLITGENRDTNAAENNGSGKSTVFKALTWGLYGKTIDGERGDKIILEGEKKATVEVSLRDNSGETWIAKRTRTKGSMKLALFKNKDKEFKASKEDIQKKIVEMVGLDYNGFKNTVLYGQNDSSRFADPRTRDSDRKKTLHDILRTSILEKCRTLVVDERKKEVLEISKKEEELYKFETQMESIDLELEKEREIRFENDKKEKIERLKEDALSYKESAVESLKESKEVGDGAELEGKIEKCQKRVDVLNDEVRKASSVKSELGELQEKLAHERDEVKGKLIEKLMDMKAKSDSITEKLEDLSGDNCPVCTSDLNGKSVVKFKDELLKKREKARVEGKKVSSKLKKQISKIGEIQEEISKFEDILDKKDEFVKKEREMFFKLSELLDEKNEKSSKFELCREKAKGLVENAKRIIGEIKELKEEENPFTTSRVDAEKKTEKLHSKREGLVSEIKSEKKELEYIRFWERGFSNQGLPSYILDNAMPFLAKRANAYLRVLSDGDIKMDFTTQRELKSRDERKDEIEITWEIEGNKDYPPSGGQLKKMELATDFALMDLVATRDGGHVDILALDEILDGLDAEGSRRVVLLLKKLNNYRSSIFVVSHLPEISESFGYSVRVTKEDGNARLERVV